MSSAKIIAYLAIVLVAVIATRVSSNPTQDVYAPNKSHHLILGSRAPGDRIVYRENVIKKSSWMKIVIVEKTFNVSRYERITMVQALDQKTNGNGAYATVLRGGPGQNNVTLRFKSQRGHGINFVVQLYAR